MISCFIDRLKAWQKKKIVSSNRWLCICQLLSIISSGVHKYSSSAQSVHVVVVVEAAAVVEVQITLVSLVQYCRCVIIWRIRSPQNSTVKLFVEVTAKFPQFHGSTEPHMSLCSHSATLCATSVDHHIQQSTDGYHSKSVSVAGNDDNQSLRLLVAHLYIKPREEVWDRQQYLL